LAFERLCVALDPLSVTFVGLSGRKVQIETSGKL
jgi:hypothetical protein